jgi:gas vesicle protein
MKMEILIGIFSLGGIIIGGLMTFTSQLIIDAKNEKKMRKNNIIKNANNISSNLQKMENIIDRIINFIETDISEIDSSMLEISEIKYDIEHISQDFWNDFRIELYLLLIKNSKSVLFQILDKIMVESKCISENIIEWQSNGNSLIDLQESFKFGKYNYYAAKYSCKLLYNEFLSNLNDKINKKIPKEYYKKHKENIIKAIANFT